MGADETILCFLSAKNVKNFCFISSEVSDIIGRKDTKERVKPRICIRKSITTSNPFEIRRFTHFVSITISSRYASLFKVPISLGFEVS
jgi:hypothetical protein